jgi:hypothetical protein
MPQGIKIVVRPQKGNYYYPLSPPLVPSNFLVVFAFPRFCPGGPFAGPGDHWHQFYPTPPFLRKNMPFLSEFRPSQPYFVTCCGFITDHAKQLFGNSGFIGRKVDIPSRSPAPHKVNVCQTRAGNA